VKLQQFRSNLTFQHKSCLQQHEEMVLQTFPWAWHGLVAGHECSPASRAITLFITGPDHAGY